MRTKTISIGWLVSAAMLAYAFSVGSSEPSEKEQRLSLELVGTDRPGIVREISQALAKRGVNVAELHTECGTAPMSNEPLFRAKADLRVPPSAPLGAGRVYRGRGRWRARRRPD